MAQRIPLMLIPLPLAKKWSRWLFGIAQRLEFLYPGLQYDLAETDIEISSFEYIGITLFNTMIIFLLFFFLFLAVSYRVRGMAIFPAAVLSFIISLFITFLLFSVLMRYPKILGGKKGELVDKNLVFALKDMSLQVSSGVSLYNALVNISSADYGLTSQEFSKVTKAVNSGVSLNEALEQMALQSKSEYLKKTSWQLVNTLKAGASVRATLKNIINDLTQDQKTRIRDYAKELNLWSLVYMVFAVAIPTIGSTMIIILSSFAGFGITKRLFLGFIIATFIIQIMIIGLVKSRRPIVHI